MANKISTLVLKTFGWKVVGQMPSDSKYVIISVPHTSMKDFIWGKLAFSTMGIKPVFFIKKEMFFFPVGNMLKKLGARPVNRGVGALSLIEQIIDFFNTNDEAILVITPEGTRSKVNAWKKGFYFIAQKANVPIYLGVIDYKQKILMPGEKFIPSGDVKKDMEYIASYYQKLSPTARHPENFSLDIK